MAPKMPAPITAPIASMIRSPARRLRFKPRGAFGIRYQRGDRLPLKELGHLGILAELAAGAGEKPSVQPQSHV